MIKEVTNDKNWGREYRQQKRRIMVLDIILSF